MGEEAPIDRETLREASENLEIERLVDLAREPPEPEPVAERTGTDATVAVADDSAFCFRYPATIERLRERASVVTFSPVAGDPLPDCDGVYLPGGYPELHGEALETGGTLAELGEQAKAGLPVLGECGGLMSLAETLTDVDGETHRMAGVLPADVEMCDRHQALDHVELRARGDSLTADSGTTLRGHEFHYSTADVASDAEFAFDVERGDGIEDGKDGLTAHRTLGTYAHVHADSGAFDRFVDRIRIDGG